LETFTGRITKNKFSVSYFIDRWQRIACNAKEITFSFGQQGRKRRHKAS